VYLYTPRITYTKIFK